MRIQQLRTPPSAGTNVTWRSLYVRGRFVQRNLATLSALRQLAVHRGLHLPLGKELWEMWDEEGVLRPIAFGLGRWDTDAVLDPEQPDTVVFREEQPFRPWDDYAVDYDFASEPHPQYSLWQLLPMHDAVAGRSVDLSVDVLLDEERREAWLDRLKSMLEGQRSAWRTLDERWASTLKLLVAGQNRFWPAISGRVVLPWDLQRGERIDPMAEETADFEPESVLADHGMSESELAGIYEWLVERGARIEGGEAPFTDGGDRWARLRRLADRREHVISEAPLEPLSTSTKRRNLSDAGGRRSPGATYRGSRQSLGDERRSRSGRTPSTTRHTSGRARRFALSS